VIAKTGGTLLGDGFLTPETGLFVGAEVAAMEQATTEIAAARAAEAHALLLALAAYTHAADSRFIVARSPVMFTSLSCGMVLRCSAR